ncbi:MAG: galactokinase [Chloroflexi bacterium HGW-Chloroflexi-3]|nr:MAG: galactokinase [Chloroflexi bacterium HGW-Chloroflexi-3]
MILCENQAFYTGWTKNISLRFRQHKIGNGSRYTKKNKPVKVVYWKTCKDKSTAMKKEIEIKKLTRKQKERLIFGRRNSMNLPVDFDQFEYLSIAPGRVNILGEHIDYNGGSVLPVAIDRYVYLGANKSNEQIIRITALDLNQTISFRIDEIEKKIDVRGNPLPDWSLYPAGVFWAASKQNLRISGFEGIFTSTIPMGTGLSSSAAVEVAFAALMREFCSWEIDNLELAKICQMAENQFIGVNCGLMDQFASANGVQNSLLFFNTTTLDWFPVELPDNVTIVITNSKIPRSLSNSAYNERRDSCEKALNDLRKNYPNRSNLCQISISEFEEVEKELEETLQKRAKHVIHECARVNQAINFLNDNLLFEFGELMKASHNSLRDLYEVSTPELDLLVSIANKINGCYGSRLTGAGFGGCIVSLVQSETVNKFVEELESTYFKKTGKEIETYVCKASDGVIVEWHELSTSIVD